MKGLVNGKIISLDKSGLDTGYFYGYGLFETIMIREGKAVLLKEHLDRLNNGLELILIHKHISEEEVLNAITVLRCYNTALKINISEKTTVFSTRAITYTTENYQKGAYLKVSNVYRNPTSPSVRLKSMNYLDNILELQKAKAKGYNDVLFLNYEKEVCETAVANIFMIHNDRIITPSLSSGILDGIIRQWVIGRYEVEERSISLDELVTSDGIFITNSLMGIMKVAVINEATIAEHETIHKITLDYVKTLKGVN